MKKLFHLVAAFVFLQISLPAQLLPSIGLNSLPADNIPICPIPWYLGSFYTSGLAEGSFAHDFKLYKTNGDSVVLSQRLATGKPVLLVAGSFTCPVFMGKIPTINQVVSTYGNQVEVYVVYTLEAHPTDTSVYFGYVNIGTANQNAGILFPQPVTYGERKHMVDTMSYWATVNAPILLDGPCNPWWTTFGPAPNNAYLIDTNGQIFSKHGWFHKNNDNIFCDLDSLLNVTSGLCTPALGNGSFQVQVINNMSNGNAGSILYDYANIINNSNDMVTVGIKKLQKNLPLGWQTAFCADVCYSPTDDSITLNIPAQDTMLFSLDFITNPVPDSGNVVVGFRNISHPNNNAQVTFRASTLPLSTGSNVLPATLRLYPNPVADHLYLNASPTSSIRIYNLAGVCIRTLQATTRVDVSDLSPGSYLLQCMQGERPQTLRFVRTP